MEDIVWLVKDEQDLPIFVAPALVMCHDHINEALDMRIKEAKDWTVRRYKGFH